MWKDNGTQMTFEVLDENDNAVISETIQNTPNVNGNTAAAVTGSTSTDLKLVPETSGNYRLKWTSNGFVEVLAMDDTRLRIVGSQEGNDDTVTLEYTPEQLIGEEPAIDVDLAGQYIARSASLGCPVTLPDSVGTWTHCSYDAQLKVVVFHYTVTELAILGVEGKENLLKNNLLNTFVATEGEDFLILLVSTGLGLELRWQSRTTPRNVTVSYTPDELKAFILERQ